MTRMLRICKATGWDFETYGRQSHLPSALWPSYHNGLSEGLHDRPK